MARAFASRLRRGSLRDSIFGSISTPKDSLTSWSERWSTTCSFGALRSKNVYEVLLLIDRPFSLGKFSKMEDAEAAVARRTRVPITALRTTRKMYYKVSLEVQVIESSDLEEVDRWLRGNIESPLKGRTNPGTALTRGLRSIAAKLLGGESRQYEVTSPSFKLP